MALDLVEHRPGAEAFRDSTPARLGPSPGLGWIGEAFDDRHRERARIFGRHEPPGLSLDDRCRRPADVGCDNRPLERQRLESSDPQTLAP